MKIIPLFLFFCLTNIFSLQAQNNTRQLTAEPNHSSIGFYVPIANLSRVTGKFTDYKLGIRWVDNNITQSVFALHIKVNSIHTGIPGRDKHLQSPMFFDAARHPEIIFKSSKIVAHPAKGKNAYLAYGALTMKGVTKSVILPFRLTGKSGKNTVGFQIRWSLNRLDYGVGNTFKHSSMADFLGKDIGIEVDFWTRKQK